jgi:DNA-binding Lrp family transcriptional regulator
MAETARKRMPDWPDTPSISKNCSKYSQHTAQYCVSFNNVTQVMLDKKDRAILKELQKDSRLTMQQLAAKVGMSSSACWRRVRSLEQAGVIDRYAVLVNPQKAGFSLSSMTLVSLARHEEKNVENFEKEVMRRPEVLECFATSGEADFHLRVVVEDIEAYNRFLDNFIFRLPGVSQVRSNIVLKEIKVETALPFRD